MAGDFEDQIARAEAKQQEQRDRQAYKDGQARNRRDREDPSNSGSPGKDGYGSMSVSEKEAYKRGFRGD